IQECMIMDNTNINKDMVIGFPRGMSFYEHYPFWYGFFNSLGIKVILSNKTTKQTVSKGASLVVTETCLPIKIFVGHVVELLEKGVKRIFVPSIQSVAPKIYNCSKIRGLPDLIRNIIKQDFELIEPTIDKSAKNQGFYQFLKESVAAFGITDFDIIRSASKEGWKLYNNFQTMMRNGIAYKDALKNALKGKIILERDDENYPISIALVAHGYDVLDDQASMKIFDKLKKMGVKVYSSLQLTDEQKIEGLNTLEQRMYWANELDMTGTAGHYLKVNKIDGLITVNSFGCGPDSLMIDKIIRKAKEYSKPILCLTIDEHTGEAGFITRLEAFVDMLYRKKRIILTNSSKSKEHVFAPKTNICENICS
ncbi:MAG: acyl-CoA dehydratase activase-related protein, partial [Candidatus Gastranaerophilales bacterium]|nr:acyl-CoA dehydratase activase-related protein [Candidatus Gastranaerophilales bacterium]